MLKNNVFIEITDITLEDPPEYIIPSASSVPIIRSKNFVNPFYENRLLKNSLDLDLMVRFEDYFNKNVYGLIFETTLYNINNYNIFDIKQFEYKISQYLYLNFTDLKIVFSFNLVGNSLAMKYKKYFNTNNDKPYYKFNNPSVICDKLPDVHDLKLISLFFDKKDMSQYFLKDINGNKIYKGVMENSIYYFSEKESFFIIDDLHFNETDIMHFININKEHPELNIFSKEDIELIKIVTL